jgi:hypothetical protein
MLTKIRNFLTLEHIAMLIISIILLQTLPFKFLWLQESVDLFTKLWQEPRGRIGSGILELLGVIGLWAPSSRSRKYAAIWIAFLMIGALYFHATVLGWDGLALSAGIVLLCSTYIAMIQKK